MKISPKFILAQQFLKVPLLLILLLQEAEKCDKEHHTWTGDPNTPEFAY